MIHNRLRPILICVSTALLALWEGGVAQAQGTDYTITRYAGVSTIAGTNDGTTNGVQFKIPVGVAFDAGGNLYVADSGNSVIRKLTPTGVSATIAGSASAMGTSDGTGSNAHFTTPGGIAVDSSGNMYVADTGNHSIRKVTPTGVVTTLAGVTGTSGFADGTGAVARFNNPTGIVLSASGDLYVADTGNNSIRKVTTAGVVTTFAGSGAAGSTDDTGRAASFRGPNSLAFDASGNLYVTDALNQTLRKIVPAGTVSTFAGSTGNAGNNDGVGVAATFNLPHGVVIDASGNIYVADSGSNLIRKVTPAGVVGTLAGATGGGRSVDGTTNAARFQTPEGLALDLNGVITVADSFNHTIRKVTTAGVVTTFAGSPSSVGSAEGTGATATFTNPYGVAIDSAKNVYVADTYNNAIRKITPGGVVTTLAGLPGQQGSVDAKGTAARFYYPIGVAVDSSGIVYVADSFNHTIRKIATDGTVTTLAGQAGAIGTNDGAGSSARFFRPSGLAVDGSGNVYVADSANNSIRKITAGGVVSTLAGLTGPGNLGFVDGTGTAARFQSPSGLSLDGAGNVIVADTINNAIRKVTPSGVVTTISGSPSGGGFIDGPVAVAHFSQPFSTAVDGAGNIYVADYNNDIVREITTAGNVIKIAGGAGLYGTENGVGNAARFFDVTGVAAEPGGTIYIVDSTNNMIRKGVPPGAPAISTQPVSQNITAGQSVTFSVSASGTGLTYQWLKDGVAISGAQTASYTISSVQTTDAAAYSVIVTTGSTSVSSDPATLAVNSGSSTVTPPPPPPPTSTSFSRLTNLSVLTSLDAAGDSYTLGYVVGNPSSSTPLSLVVRAAGPSLGALGVGGTLADPKLETFVVNTKTGENDNWGGSDALRTAMASVGAFAYVSATSLDAAAVVNATSSDNSVRISSTNNGTGLVISEVYDASSGTVTSSAPRLINVSVLKNIGSGLTAGFVIGGGTDSKKVLVRAIGPTLATSFGVGGVVADPQLVLFKLNGSTSTQIGANDNWGGDSTLATTMASVGAFTLPANSKDAALVATLQPGNYTVQVSGVGGTGVALVEVYEIPN